jgi:hypothetical protein
MLGDARQGVNRRRRARCHGLKGKGELQAQRGSGGVLRGALALLGDFGELAGFYVVDETAYRDVLDVGVVLDAGDLAPDILLDVLEGVKVRRGYG